MEKSRRSAASTPGPGNTFRAEDDLKGRIRMRQLYTRVLNDPATQSEWDAAHQVKTDPERRALLKIYYTHLYDRMLKLDPIAGRADQRAEERQPGALAIPAAGGRQVAQEADSALAEPGIPSAPPSVRQDGTARESAGFRAATRYGQRSLSGKRRLRLGVRTRPSQGRDAGSIPVGATIQIYSGNRINTGVPVAKPALFHSVPL